MTQAQLKYIRQRAEAIYADRRKQVEQDTLTPAVYLSAAEKLQALTDNLWTAGEGYETASPHQWSYYIRFVNERPAVVDLETRGALLTELKTQYTKLMDELMLGDNEEALKLLKAFEIGG